MGNHSITTALWGRRFRSRSTVNAGSAPLSLRGTRNNDSQWRVGNRGIASRAGAASGSGPVKLLTITAVARIKGVSREVVRLWFASGLGFEIPGLKRKRTTLEAVEVFLAGRVLTPQMREENRTDARPISGPIESDKPRQVLTKRTVSKRAAGTAKLKKGEWRERFR